MSENVVIWRYLSENASLGSFILKLSSESGMTITCVCYIVIGHVQLLQLRQSSYMFHPYIADTIIIGNVQHFQFTQSSNMNQPVVSCVIISKIKHLQLRQVNNMNQSVVANTAVAEV